MGYEINPIRWYLKKGARRAVVSLSKILAGENRTPKLRVLTYHRFGGTKYDPVAVKPRDFDVQLQWLIHNVDILTTEEFCAVLNGTRTLTRDAVFITIDDGHRSFYDKAYPILKHYALPAIVFVCPGLVNPSDQTSEFMSWDELSTVRYNNIEVASHGFSHRSLGKLSSLDAEKEIMLARQHITKYLGTNNAFFAFPFGTKRDFSPVLADILLKHGYRYCFTSVHGPCVPISRANLYPRIKVESGESLEMFCATVKGFIDAWRLVDNIGWYFQQRDRF